MFQPARLLRSFNALFRLFRGETCWMRTVTMQLEIVRPVGRIFTIPARKTGVFALCRHVVSERGQTVGQVGAVTAGEARAHVLGRSDRYCSFNVKLIKIGFVN
jgi:hypothetical protein